MDIAVSVLNILFFLVGCYIVLRVYFSVTRVERVLALLEQFARNEEVARNLHMEMLQSELSETKRVVTTITNELKECKE